MNYEDIDVEKEVAEVVRAVEEGKIRPAPKYKTLQVRLAAEKMLQDMAKASQANKELVEV